MCRTEEVVPAERVSGRPEIAHEIADLLEATSRTDPSKIDLAAYALETDVLVVGGGGAGTSAAILAAEQGARVIMATKLRNGDANTMMAEGGIQAATKGHKDSTSTSPRSQC